MTRYSVQPRDRIFVKRYGFLCLARNVGRSMSKTLSSIYSEKLLDHAKFLIIQSAKDALGNSLKKAIQKTAGNLIGSKIADKTARFSKTSPQKNPKTIKEEILRERYISPEKRLKIIDDLRWTEYNNAISKIINLLDDTTNQQSKFRTRNLVEVNDESRRTYNENNDI